MIIRLVAVCALILANQVALADAASVGLPPSSVAETQEPAQQFVMSDTEPSSTTTTSSPGDNSDAEGPPPEQLIAAAQAGNNPQQQVSIPAASATALGPPGTTNEQAPKPFAGGLDSANFVNCMQMARAVCQQASGVTGYQNCITKIKVQQACTQFLAFAASTGMGPKDNIDVIKEYKEGQFYLIHLQRFGANYPGVYYSIGSSGDFQDLIFGSFTQALDIRKDPNYAQIAAKFPNVQLFSIVDKLPQTAPTPSGSGVRLILRFQLFNGCHACERAGYANVAFDFSANGTLTSSSIVSLDPSS